MAPLNLGYLQLYDVLAKARSQGSGLFVMTLSALSAWGTVKINIGNGQT